MPEATLHASPFSPLPPFLILEHSIFVLSNKEIDYILMFQVFLIGVSCIFGDFDLKISHSVASPLSKLVSYKPAPPYDLSDDFGKDIETVSFVG